MQKCVELQCLVDDLVNIFRIIKKYFFYLYYLMKWIGDSDIKKTFLLGTHLYQFFFKTVTDDLNK